MTDKKKYTYHKNLNGIDQRKRRENKFYWDIN